MVIWFTGQPGSGKTTLANKFIEDKLIGFMKIQPVRIVHIDGDDLREELKMERNIAEFYLHTTELRGREDYFAKGYEPPLHNFTDIDTNKPIEECVNEIFDVYRQMATVA